MRGAYALPAADRERLVVGVEHVLLLGPRVVAELLIEVSDDVPHLLRRLDDYRRLSAELASALGANDWTKPIRAAVRGRRAA